jgi:hypothetical protein
MPGHPGQPEFLHGLAGLPLWDNDGGLLVLNGPNPGVEPASGVRMLSFGGGRALLAAALTGDGTAIVAVNTDGEILVVDRSSGEVHESIPGPPNTNQDDSALGEAAINPSGQLVARISGGVATIFDLHTHQDIGAIPGNDVSVVRFTASRLLVQRKSGNLEVWDERGTGLARVILGDQGYNWPPVADGEGRIVARLDGGYGIDLFDLATGALVNTIPPRLGSFRTSYTFAPNGLSLVTTTDYPYGSPAAAGGADLTVRNLAAPELVAAACIAAGGNLSADEWVSLAGVGDPGTAGCN